MEAVAVSNSSNPTGFRDKAEFQEIFGELISQLLVHPIIGPKLARSKLCVRFEYTNPDTSITINFKDGEPKSSWDDNSSPADVTFKQTADFSNRFWQGKENVIAAMAKRQVTATGSITKALALIPVIRPSFRIYPQVLQKLGKNHLIVN